MSQDDLAKPVYSGAFVSQIESGKRKPSDAAARFLAERLGVDVEYLLHGRDETVAPQIMLGIQEAKSTIYAGRPEEAIQSLLDLIEQARAALLDHATALAVQTLGFALERLGRINEALVTYQEAEDLEVGFPLHFRVGTITGMARCLQQLGDVRYAVHLLESYLLDLQKAELQDPTALMRAHSSLIGPYFALGMTDQAIKAAEEARRLEVRIADPEQVACMNINVARVLLFEGKAQEASAALAKAEEVFSHFGWKTEIARANIAFAIVHVKQDQLEQARRFLTEAIGLLQDAQDPLDEARARNELARVERLLSNDDGCRLHAGKVLDLVAQGDPRVRAFAWRELALAAENPADAEKAFRQAIDLYRLAKDPAETASTFRALGDWYRAEGDTAAMADAYREGIEAIEERAY